MSGESRAQGAPSNGDYSLIIDQDQQEKYVPNGGGSDLSISPPSASRPAVYNRQPIDIILNHPALPVAAYCASSILMTVINKFVVSGAHFTMNLLLLTIQSVVCVGCVMACKFGGLITFRDFDVNDARKWLPISILLTCVIYTGSKALQYLSIPVYTIFKNLTIVLIAYGEVLWFSGSITGLTMVSFGLMIMSSIMAAWGDISRYLFGGVVEATAKATTTSGVGYVWMVINCFASAGYVLAMRKRIKITNFRDWDTMLYNNVLAIPVLVIFSLLVEDWSAASLARNFPAEGRGTLIFAMCFSGGAAVFISYTTAWCVRTTSSTTFSMVGALNKLPVAASGMVFFSDPVTITSVSSILTGFIAGLVYAAAKSAQSAQAKMMSAVPGSVDLGKPR